MAESDLSFVKCFSAKRAKFAMCVGILDTFPCFAAPTTILKWLTSRVFKNDTAKVSLVTLQNTATKQMLKFWSIMKV